VIVISTHAVFINNKDVYGPPHAVSLYLNKKKINHIFIKHRLEGDGFSRVEYYEKGKLKKVIERGYPKRLKLYFQYLFEILLSLKITWQDAKNCGLFIGVDPLNAVAGTILGILGKTENTVYFSADFALKRFEDPILNSIYLWLDKNAMFSSSYTWSVSTRIVEYRRTNGLDKKKNLLLPNAPFFDDVKRLDYKTINRHDLVIVSAINKGINFNLLVDSVFELRKKVRNIRLIIIGSGPEESNVKKYVRKMDLQKNILFLGTLSHEKMFEVLRKSALGIALYSDSDPSHFRFFSDSMKARDYMASGLPVIISGNSAIGYEIEKEKAGILVKLKKKDIVKVLLNILTSENIYQTMRNNAIELARKNDTGALINKYFTLIYP